MAINCKKGFVSEANNLYAFVSISFLAHLALFWQVSSKLSSTWEPLLGKTGGPLEAREVAFFPSFGQSSASPKIRNSSPIDLPTDKKQGSNSTSETDLVSKRGIGAGGTQTEYHAILHAYLDSVKVFPRHLKDLGLSGVVRVQFEVSTEGYLENIRLSDDSQAPQALQNEAIRFLQRLDRVPLPPQHFSKKDLQFEVPLRYELKT